MRIIHGLVLLLVARESVAQWFYPDQNICTTPDRKPGTCINIKSCQRVMELLSKNLLTPADRNYLQQSQCGYDGKDPKVCCPSNSNGQSGQTPTTSPKPTNSNNIPDVTKHPNLRLLDLNNCGQITSDRIVGGTPAGLTEFPWMALLAYDIGSMKPEFRCGGSVINYRYILTAAHCVTTLPSNTRLVGVRVGEYDITTEQDCKMDDNNVQQCNEKYQDFGLESIGFHHEYSRSSLHNDIALIRVDRNIDFRPANAKPICMPIGSAATISSSKLVVTGWGLYEARVSSPIMLKVSLPIFDEGQCKSVYQRQTEIWYKQICMGGQQGRDSCSGDSGGPLQAPVSNYNGKPRYVQYGVVSFGVRNCGTQGFPGVYTKVAYYLDWILDNMRP